jgi:hypothetical protein
MNYELFMAEAIVGYPWRDSLRLGIESLQKLLD